VFLIEINYADSLASDIVDHHIIELCIVVSNALGYLPRFHQFQ